MAQFINYILMLELRTKNIVLVNINWFQKINFSSGTLVNAPTYR